MPYTPLVRAGAEANGSGANVSGMEWDSASQLTITTTTVKSGSRAYSCSQNSAMEVLRYLPATTHVRGGCHFQVPTAPADWGALLASFRTAADWACDLWFLANNRKLKAYINGGSTVIGTHEFVIGESVTNYRNIAWDYSLDSANGWLRVWVDGELDIEILGNTGLLANFDRLRLYTNSHPTRAGYFIMDDYYLDDATGEVRPDVAPPDYRLVSVLPNGDGDLLQWQVTPGPTHYTAIDEAPYNLTDRLEAAAIDLDELWHLATLAIPEGMRLNAVIPYFIALRTDGSVLTTLTPLIKSGGVLGMGTPLSLGTSAGLVWQRFAAPPEGGGWDQAKLDALQMGARSSGDY
jgi:hypothetical protein